MDAAEYIPLARAAALAYARLFPGDGAKDAKTLDLVALALSARLPLYQQGAENAAPRRLRDDEVAAGRFTRGATRLEFAGRPALRFLLVSRRELYPAIEALAKDPACPIFSCRRSPPACSSATGA